MLASDRIEIFLIVNIKIKTDEKKSQKIELNRMVANGLIGNGFL